MDPYYSSKGLVSSKMKFHAFVNLFVTGNQSRPAWHTEHRTIQLVAEVKDTVDSVQSRANCTLYTENFLLSPR